MGEWREGPPAGQGQQGRPDARRGGERRIEVDGLVVPLPLGSHHEAGAEVAPRGERTVEVAAPGLDADGLIALYRPWAEGADVELEDRVELAGAFSLVFRRLDGGGVTFTLLAPSGDRAEPLLRIVFRPPTRRGRGGRGAW